MGVFLQKDMDGGFDYKQIEGFFCKKSKERPGSTSCDRSDGSRRASSPVAPRVATGEGSAERAPSPRRIEVRVFMCAIVMLGYNILGAAKGKRVFSI